MAGNAGQLSLDDGDYPSPLNLTDEQLMHLDPTDPDVQAMLAARARGLQAGGGPAAPGTDRMSVKLALEGMNAFPGARAPLEHLLQQGAPATAPQGAPAEAGEPFTPGRMLMRTLLTAKQGGGEPAFDPDAYLAAKAAPAAPAFDPDAYLAEKAPAKTSDAAPGALSTFIRSAGHFPGVDQAAGAIGAYLNVPGAPAMALLDPAKRAAMLHDYRFIRDASHNDREAGAAEHPWVNRAGIATNIGLSLLAPIPKVGAAANATTLGTRLLGATKAGAAFGGASGLLDGRADLTKGDFGQAALDTLVGAGAGALLGPAIHGTVEGAGYLAGKLSGPLRRLAERMAYRATDGKLRDINLATRNSPLSPGERLQQIGGQMLDEGGVHFGDTPEKVAERLGPIRQRLGAEKGAAVDALDAARPVNPHNNAFGIAVPGADTLTAGPDGAVPTFVPPEYGGAGGPNPGTPGNGTIAGRDVPSRNSPYSVEEVPARAPTEYAQPEQAAGMRETAIPRTPEVVSPPLRNRTLLDRQVIARALDAQADALSAKTGARGVADRLRAEAEAIRSGPDQKMTFQGAETLKTSYGKAFNKLGENDGNEARKMVYDTIKSHVEREAQAVDPELAGKFKTAKERFANVKPAEDAAGRGEKRALANQLGGILHVAGLGSAATLLAEGRPGAAAMAALSPIAYKAIQRRGPASTASAANALSKLLRRAPELGAQLSAPAAVAAERELVPGLRLPPGMLPSFASSDEDDEARALQMALRAAR